MIRRSLMAFAAGVAAVASLWAAPVLGVTRTLESIGYNHNENL